MSMKHFATRNGFVVFVKFAIANNIHKLVNALSAMKGKLLRGHIQQTFQTSCSKKLYKETVQKSFVELLMLIGYNRSSRRNVLEFRFHEEGLLLVAKVAIAMKGCESAKGNCSGNLVMHSSDLS